jgi:large subunit ribosomal protein L3
MRTTPGRLWKGKRMAGHYGNETITIKNLKVIQAEAGRLTIAGTVPGSRGARLRLVKL